MRRTKRIRRALKVIAKAVDGELILGGNWTDGDDEVKHEDIVDALDWLFEQAEDLKPTSPDVLLRSMGAPELFPLDKVK